MCPVQGCAKQPPTKAPLVWLVFGCQPVAGVGVDHSGVLPGLSTSFSPHPKLPSRPCHLGLTYPGGSEYPSRGLVRSMPGCGLRYMTLLIAITAEPERHQPLMAACKCGLQVSGASLTGGLG